MWYMAQDACYYIKYFFWNYDKKFGKSQVRKRYNNNNNNENNNNDNNQILILPTLFLIKYTGIAWISRTELKQGNFSCENFGVPT